MAAPDIAETAVTETSAVALSVAEGTPLEADADATREPVAGTEAAEQPAEPVAETATAAEREAAPAQENMQEDMQEDIRETVQEAAPQPDEPEAVWPEPAPPVATVPAVAEPAGAEAADKAPRSLRIGASFVFVPTLAPLTEINARLFAFARGEGEAALAHLQALTRAKSPAEAIRLQVTEMQRAADASLTCFSEIVRSANRLHDTARWH
ncbi:MAG: phasin family protein [Methylorubrum populi]